MNAITPHTILTILTFNLKYSINFYIITRSFIRGKSKIYINTLILSVDYYQVTSCYQP